MERGGAGEKDSRRRGPDPAPAPAPPRAGPGPPRAGPGPAPRRPRPAFTERPPGVARDGLAVMVARARGTA